MAQRKFIINGLAPAYGEAANQFIRAMDLGVEGAYIKVSELVTITIDDGLPQEKLDKQPGALVKAYEQVKHWQKITIMEV